MMKNSFKVRYFVLFFAIFLTTTAFAAGKEYLRIRSGSLPGTSEDEASRHGPTAAYYLASGDVIEVFVWQHTDISRTVKIRPDGMLSYPLVGTIRGAGLTIDELQVRLTEELSKYIRSPLVTVTVNEFVGNKIIVLGEVNYPGIYTYSGTINLLEALALAGDFTEDGKRDSVIVVSDNLTESPEVRRVNLFRAIRRGTSKRDVILKPNDLIYVPRHFIADIQKFWTDYGTTIDRAKSIFDWRQSLRDWYHHGEEN
jgi:polysaccharide export outer membrane protein